MLIGWRDYDAEQLAGSSVPIIVIGTKLHQVQSTNERGPSRASSVAEECGADEIKLVSRHFVVGLCCYEILNFNRGLAGRMLNWLIF